MDGHITKPISRAKIEDILQKYSIIPSFREIANGNTPTTAVTKKSSPIELMSSLIELD